MLEKKYDFKATERKWQKYWEEIGVYRFDGDSTRELFSIDTPPPTVNGKLHIGHIFSYTQAEIIARFRRMSGYNVFYPFGFDDNGLPTERLVEKEEGIKAADLPRGQFIEKCLAATARYEDQFKSLWQSLGFSVDWTLQYETISPLSQRISQLSFIELYEKGLAYQKESPVLWCTNCRTSIAQAELEWQERDTAFNWICFDCEGIKLEIATTRPELLFGCTALFVNPEDNRYSKLIGKYAKVPLYDYLIPIIGDEKVSVEMGSGIVMCATFGDTTDMEWYNTYGLPYRRVIEEDGRISDEIPYIGGLKIEEGRTKIIEVLKQKGQLLKQEKITHSVAVHERCGHPVEILPSRQWYIDLMNHKELFLKAGNEINWYPTSMKTRYDIWVQNLKWDWCISRQRYFGVPIPVWYCSDCGEVLVASRTQLPVNPMEDKPSGKCKCGGTDFMAEKAVLDTWATSSMTPFINSRWQENEQLSPIMPMSMRTQAHEIIRTWAFYTIVKSLYHTGQIPWKDIMICGFVMADKKEKISKSKENAENSPEQLISEYSADALRYWAAGTKLGSDTMFSNDEMSNSRRLITKLWNAARFALMHLQDYDQGMPDELLPVDAWILEQLKYAEKKASKYLIDYDAGGARQVIDEFFWSDFCDNYLEIIKDRLYKPEIHGYEARKSGQHALYKVLLGILRLYAIFIPHITEEIYQAYFRHKEGFISIHMHQWESSGIVYEKLLEFGSCLEEIIKEIRRYKSEKNQSLKSTLSKLLIKIEEKYLEDMKKSRLDLLACTSAGELVLEASDHLEIHIVE